MGFFTSALGAYCPFCRERVATFRALCPFCFEELELWRESSPRRLKLRLASGTGELPIVATAHYEGFAKQLVLTQKTAKDPSAVMFLADTLLAMMPPEWRALPFVWVPPTAWAPIHFVECVGAALARRGLTVWGAGPLRRRLRILPQKSKGLTARLGSRDSAYVPSPRWRRPRNALGDVILLDDIITTGATLQSCAAIVAAVGLNPVGALALAATPSHRGPGSPLLTAAPRT